MSQQQQRYKVKEPGKQFGSLAPPVIDLNVPIDPLAVDPVEWQKLRAKPPTDAVLSQSDPLAKKIEEPLSKKDTGENHQCPKSPVMKNNTDENHQCGKSSGMKNTSVENHPLTPQADFTGIPNCLLRDRENRPTFEQPIDFQIYCHFLSYSYGNDRRECELGQDQLMKLTNSLRQRVKQSLDRLIAAGWLECIKEYSACKEKRRWRVFTPFELGKTNQETYLPKKANTGENHQCRKSSVMKNTSITGENHQGKKGITGENHQVTIEEVPSNTSFQDTHTQAIETYLNNLVSFDVQKSERVMAEKLIEKSGSERVHEAMKLCAFDDKGQPITKKMAWLTKIGMDQHKAAVEAIIANRNKTGDQAKDFGVPELSPEEQAKADKARAEAMAAFSKRGQNQG